MSDPQHEINSNSDAEPAGVQKNQISASLKQLGYDDWFEAAHQKYRDANISVARVVEVNRNNYKVSDGRHEMMAELSGKYLFNIESSLEYPTVGDWVGVQCFDNDTLAIIHHLLPRKSLLKRKDPGKATEFQLIAANLDYALIMQSADANFNMNRLERYFVMVHESAIQPMVVLSKTDLISAEELAQIKEQLNRFQQKYLFLPISNVTDDGISILIKELEAEKTYCLLGSSGVGKTTLLNNLLGERRFDVNEVREKDNRGRHTTTRRQLIRIESGSIFIDTPGMRELGNYGVDAGLEETFDEIVACSSQCRFKDCTHTHEDGCAVKEAVAQGTIESERYNNFLKLQKESAFYEMSSLDKRKRDKSFGKMVKNYKKMMRKK